MLFNSVSFLTFFPAVTALYFWLAPRHRIGLLLAASCYFYMAFIPAYVLILVALIIVDYTAGLLIERASGIRRRLLLIGSLAANLGVLAVFKYANFFTTQVLAIARMVHWNLPEPTFTILLPIGLSFHTFQSMSYTIEVFRRTQPAERNLLVYALYVMFYPQLVAGPIERPSGLLRQLHEAKSFEYRRVTDGMKLMAWGFFQKLVIADRLAIIVNHIYSHPTHYEGLPLLIATVAFSFQIYCDFSGYSDIAIGAAQVMGFQLRRNFDRPYFAQSVQEFWRRWHMSLSTWCRDYVYLPLGGSRVPRWRWAINIMVTFLLSGLWHGANWTFVLWGALHGSYMLVSAWTARVRARVAESVGLARWPRLSAGLRAGGVFVMVSLAWVLFRAQSVSEAWYIFRQIFGLMGGHLSGLSSSSLVAMLSNLGMSKRALLLTWGFVGVLLAAHLIQGRGSVRQRLAGWPGWARWGAYYGTAATILLFGVFAQSPFIYFQF